MNRSISKSLFVVFLVGLLFMGITNVQAGSRDLNAGKREKYEDDTAVSMRDMYERREKEEQIFREKMLENNIKTTELLQDIKKLLQQMYELEKSEKKDK